MTSFSKCLDAVTSRDIKFGATYSSCPVRLRFLYLYSTFPSIFLHEMLDTFITRSIVYGGNFLITISNRILFVQVADLLISYLLLYVLILILFPTDKTSFNSSTNWITHLASVLFQCCVLF